MSEREDASTAPGPAAEQAPVADEEFRVEDRRHSARVEDAAEPPTRMPSIVDELRSRAEDAERKLQEYIEAFKRHKAEQEEVRLRLARDVERRVEMRFGELVAELLGTLDNLDLALDHARQSAAESSGLVRGVELARKHFLDTLETHGVERLWPDGAPFDPHEAEAVRVDSVPEAERDGTVTEVVRPGYRLGARVIRPARVAVGRHAQA